MHVFRMRLSVRLITEDSGHRYACVRPCLTPGGDQATGLAALG